MKEQGPCLNIPIVDDEINIRKIKSEKKPLE